jgi:hypothetical protein
VSRKLITLELINVRDFLERIANGSCAAAPLTE